MSDSAAQPSYEIDDDGFPRELVGSWAQDKHTRLARYVDISRSVRSKFLGETSAGATYIDLYSGPGRVRIRDTNNVADGSPLVAWKKSVEGQAPFSEVHVADDDPRLLKAVEARLKVSGAPVVSEVGIATETVNRVTSKLDPYALHFAFLDPYNLKALPFEIIRRLAQLSRMDILIHVSIQDLQRNLQRYIESQNSPLDSFAPGWRNHVDVSRAAELVRAKYLEYWRQLIKAEGMSTTESAELIVGSQNQRLYLLAFAARHPLALKFWDRVRNIETNPQGVLL